MQGNAESFLPIRLSIVYNVSGFRPRYRRDAMIPAQPAPHRIDLHPLMPLYLVIFIAFIGYSMMVTIFVPMLMDGGGFFHEGAASGTKTVYAGLVLALYPLGQFFGAPVLGALSDRYGRKRVLSISLLVTILFYLVIAYSLRVESLWLLMSACFLCGLSESNVAIVRSAIADVSGTDDRGRLFAYVYAATSLGYIAGPLLGGQFAVHFGYAAPFWIVIGLLVIATCGCSPPSAMHMSPKPESLWIISRPSRTWRLFLQTYPSGRSISSIFSCTFRRSGSGALYRCTWWTSGSSASGRSRSITPTSL